MTTNLVAYGYSKSMNAEQKFMRFVMHEPTSGCWLWVGAVRESNSCSHGHLKIDGQYVLAHRQSYRLFCGNIPDGMVVRHKCDNGYCVNPCHLELGSQADNMRDMRARGRKKQPRGERIGGAKLTPEEVLEIWGILQVGSYSTLRSLGEKYGVSPSAIMSIRDGKKWSHLNLPKASGTSEAKSARRSAGAKKRWARHREQSCT